MTLANMPQAHLDDVIRGDKQAETQDGTHRLGDDRSIGGSCNPHLKYCDEDQFQDDVDDRGEDEEVQWVSAVSDGLQDAAGGIVENEGADSQKIDAYVELCVVENTGRRLHPDKHDRGKKIPEQR